MIPELAVFPLLLKRDNFKTYRNSINLTNAKQSMKEVYGLYMTLDKLMESMPQDSFTLDEFTAYYWFQHPMMRKEERDLLEETILRPLLEMGSISLSNSFNETLLVDIDLRARASKMALLSYDVSVGKAEFSSLVAAIKEVPSKENDSTNFITDDLNVLLNEAVVGGGIRWRLESLNHRLGPLRRGNMGCVFGRPEVGKTTFLASQVTYMATQVEKPILWFNNEEDGSIVKLRCYQATLGKDLPWLISNKELAFKEFMTLTKGNIKIFDEGKIRKSQVEKLCNQLKPSLVVIDKLDFISDFEAERKDLVLEAIYRWAREISREFCPVIGVCHADGSAEGIKYVTMEHMDNAKTSKQATCDWILGIGQVNESGMDYIRGFYLSKNKLMGDSGTNPTLRHDKWDVIIKPDTCQFADLRKPR